MSMRLSDAEIAHIAEIAVTVRNATMLAVDAGYVVNGADNVLVARPGKFEGAAWYVPYYWDAVLDGGGETLGESDDGVLATRLLVTRAEHAAFSIPDKFVSVLLWESDSGFIYLHLETKAEGF